MIYDRGSPSLRALAVVTTTLLLGGAMAMAQEVDLLPIGDAWAKNSVNTTIFRNDPITTVGDQQFAAYYNADGHVVMAKRKIGAREWTPTVTPLTGKVADAHNCISLIADGDGYLHLSWDHHGNPLRYARSVAPGSTEFETPPMSGETEGNVTYPQFFKQANGDLIFMFRDGASGRGNLAINHYDTKAKVWSQMHANLISGENRRNAYWQACVDGKGSIHVSWVWRESGDVATNHDICYARSDDGGKTWKKSDGTAYALPITAATAEIAAPVPQKQELINQTSMCTDTDGHPIIATYFRPVGATVVQYFIIRHDGTKWQTIQATDRKTSFSLSGGGSKQIPISRPQVLARNADGKSGVWIIFRDTERGSRVSMAACEDLASPKWTTTDLTDFSVGFWEPSYDHVRWQRDGVLDLYVQNVGQGDGEKLQEIAPQPAQVLEWTPKK
ncbi:MAG: neuraminidase [Phycisphaerales bacterium]|nr:neuraminidase [Phycisphaerales bacterium]